MQEYQRKCNHKDELHWKECPECREYMIRKEIDQNFIGKEATKESVQKLHDNSEIRTSELECSQDGYEFGLEDVLLLIK